MANHLLNMLLGDVSEMQTPRSRGMVHESTKTPYEQFKQEYPKLDAYGRKVVSGRQFKETMGNLASALDNTSGQLMEGKADTGAGNIMDYLGMAGITKAKSMMSTGAVKDIEYHLSSEPDLIPGKTFAEQKRTVSSVGERGYGAEGQGDNIFTTRDPQSWRDQFEMELSQDAPDSIPQYLYEVMAKNKSPEGYLGEASNLPGDVTVLRRVIESMKADPLGEGSIPGMLRNK